MIIIHNDNSNNRDKIPWKEFQQTHLDSAVIHQQIYWKSSRNLAELQPDKHKAVNSFSALGQSIPARLCNTFSYYLPVADKAFAYDAMSYSSKKYEVYGDCKSSFMVYRSGMPPPHAPLAHFAVLPRPRQPRDIKPPRANLPPSASRSPATAEMKTKAAGLFAATISLVYE